MRSYRTCGSYILCPPAMRARSAFSYCSLIFLVAVPRTRQGRCSVIGINVVAPSSQSAVGCTCAALAFGGDASGARYTEGAGVQVCRVGATGAELANSLVEVRPSRCHYNAAKHREQDVS
jgi:hypothetical protein